MQNCMIFLNAYNNEFVLFPFFSTESQDERAAMLKALKQSESLFSRYYLNEEFNDVKFDFKLRDDIVIGSPFR